MGKPEIPVENQMLRVIRFKAMQFLHFLLVCSSANLEKVFSRSFAHDVIVLVFTHKISTRVVCANGKQPRFKTPGWKDKGFEVCFKLSSSGSLRKEEVERERTQLLLRFVVLVVNVRPFLFIVYLTNKFVTKLRPLKDIFMYTSFLHFL